MGGAAAFADGAGDAARVRFIRVGTWIDESLGVYAGWTVIEDSFADGMPLRDRKRDLTLIFSGEEYGHRNLAAEGDESQAAFLLRLASNDPAFPSRLDGLFHGLLAESTTGSVTLFNDRYGMHRLCYHESEGAFYFAAEAKAILAARPDLRVPSLQGLGEFLACSCVLENRTIFKDIAVMPAASRWIFRNGELKQKETYFDPKEWEEQAPLDAESYYQGLRESLAKSLPSYFEGPQRTADRADRRNGYAGDSGAIRSSCRIVANVYLRGHVPGLPRCADCAKSGRCLPSDTPGDHGRATSSSVSSRITLSGRFT